MMDLNGTPAGGNGATAAAVLVKDSTDRAFKADVIDALVVAPRVHYWYSHGPRQDALRALTGLRPENMRQKICLPREDH